MPTIIWLISHLIAGAMPAPDAAIAGQAGISCSYQACMTKCTTLSGSICNSYCDAKIRERLATRVCVAQNDMAHLPDETD